MDNASTTRTSAQSIVIYDALSVTTSSLAETSVGGTYSETLASTGGTTPKTWSLVSGVLPAGLSLAASTGAITGTPSEPGTSSFTVQVACCSTGATQQALSIQVNAAPDVNTTSLPDGSVTQPYSQTLSSSSGTGAHTWSIVSGTLPAGLGLAPSTGAITGTPSAAGTANFTVQVTDAASSSDTQALAIIILDQPTITTSSLSAVTVGQSVSRSLDRTGGSGPFTWSISAGALPDGVSLASSTGALTGTPTTAGTANFTARVVDSNTLDDTQALTWLVNAAPAITNESLPTTTINRPLEALTLTATGGTGALHWAATGLPAGVTLTTGGLLSGTPTVSGSFPLTITVIDENSVEGEKALTLTINPPPDISTTTLPRGTTGVAYSQALASTGGTGDHDWTLFSGVLPAGLSLSAGGTISGTPTTLETVAITVKITDQAGAADTQALSLQVVDPVDITTTGFDNITVGQAINTPVQATGGFAPYTWSVLSGSLPSGLSLDAASGAVTGAATAIGTASFTLKVVDTDGRLDAQALSWLANPTVQVTTNALPTATVGAEYAFTPTSTGGSGAITWTADALPLGIVLDPATGALSGTPTHPGQPMIRLTATDANSVADTAALTMEISPALEILTESVPSFTVGKFARFHFDAEGGLGPYEWNGDAPAGMRFRNDGVLFGTPTAPGPLTLEARVSDSNGARARRTHRIEIIDRIGFEVSPTALGFEAVEDGPPTSPKQVAVSSTPAGEAFALTVDQPWLSASFSASTTPAVVDLSADPTGLEPGEYTASVTITGTDQIVAVAFTVTPRVDPTLTLNPERIDVSTTAAGATESRLVSIGTTGDPGPIEAREQTDQPWLSVRTRPAAAGGTRTAILALEISPNALAAGDYEAIIVVSAGDLSVELPVRVSVSDVEFDLSHSGLTFEAILDGSAPLDQDIRILAAEPTTLDWQASVDQPWASISGAAGTAGPLSTLQVQIDTAGLEPGSYASLLTVTAQPSGVERQAEIRVRIDEGAVKPEAAPAGLLFLSVEGETPDAKEITLSYAGDSPLGFVQAISPAAANAWLSVTPSSGAVAAGGSLALTVEADPTGLAAGSHNATVGIEFADGVIRVVNVSLLITAEECAPTQLLPIFTKLGDHFAARQGWPSAVELLVADNCGQPLSDGAGLLELSAEGEPAIALMPGPNGLWTGTWTPNSDHTDITVTATVENEDGSLVGSTTITGSVE